MPSRLTAGSTPGSSRTTSWPIGLKPIRSTSWSTCPATPPTIGFRVRAQTCADPGLGFGHATGTGLPVMDYLLADPVTIPQAVRHLFAEKIYDLPALITIEPAPPDVPPTPLPMLRNGYVTFGVFNRIDKISDPALAVWSRLLRRCRAPSSSSRTARWTIRCCATRLIARFVAARSHRGPRQRCLGSTSRPQHLAMFADIDIALDPFPQNGGISTWEPLQMGVPVVTKLGTGGPAARAGGVDRQSGRSRRLGRRGR